MNTSTFKNTSETQVKPWWSFGMVWMIIAGPAVVVVAAFATLKGITSLAVLGNADHLRGMPIHLIALGMPALLCLFGVTMILCIGLIGRLYSEASREWWARQGAWTIILSLAWLGLCAMSLYGPPLASYVVASAGGTVAAQRESLARATAALDRAIDVLLPREAPVLYGSQGGAERLTRGGSLLA